MLFHMKWNKSKNGTAALLDLLSARLPESWSVSRRSGPSSADDGVDAVVRLKGPDGRFAEVAIEFKSQLDPRDVPGAAIRLRRAARQRPALVWADFLGPRTRELLAKQNSASRTPPAISASACPARRCSYNRSALTGIRAALQSAQVAEGTGTGRAVRALCDFKPPYGIRELANCSATALGSRRES